LLSKPKILARQKEIEIQNNKTDSNGNLFSFFSVISYLVAIVFSFLTLVSGIVPIGNPSPF
jgi:hypothetical protein